MFSDQNEINLKISNIRYPEKKNKKTQNAHNLKDSKKKKKKVKKSSSILERRQHIFK